MTPPVLDDDQTSHPPHGDRLGMPLAPVSWGELLDKISILELKADRIPDAAAVANVRRELHLLEQVAEPVRATPQLAPLVDQLRQVNRTLWDIEDDIRRKELLGAFDDGFVALARAVYQTNDRRAAIKRRINDLLGSALVEEKHHPVRAE